MTDNTTGRVTSYVVGFSAEEWRQLHDYLKHVEELMATSFVRKGANIQMNLHWEESGSTSWNVKVPPDNEVHGFLHRLRPLILERDEPACFVRIRSVLHRKLKDTPLSPVMKWLLEVFDGRDQQKLIVMRSNNTVINCEETLRVWLNAYEYHRDRDKQAALERLHQILPLEWSRAAFLNLLVEKTKAISQLANLAEFSTGLRDSLNIDLRSD